MNLTSVCYLAVDGRENPSSKVDFLCEIAHQTNKMVSFGDVLILTASGAEKQYDNIRVVNIRNLDYIQYGKFVFNEAHHYTNKQHIMLFQDDGFLTHTEFWDDDFLSYDYIGAPWSHSFPWSRPGYEVGNGGFSLRSRRLYDECSKLRFVEGMNEDGLISIAYKDHLISRGIKFASVDVARKFSFEYPFDEFHQINKTLGFHGKHNIEYGTKVLFNKKP